MCMHTHTHKLLKMRLFNQEHMTEKELIYHVYKEVPETEKQPKRKANEY